METNLRSLVALVLLLVPFLAAAQPCTNGTVRLVGGPVESAGRVEVCIHGVWGRVCVANRYGLYGNYSRVVCRQLGYNVDAGEGITAAEAAFGRGTGPILVHFVRCAGTESSLLNCSHSGIDDYYYYRYHYCYYYYNDAGVVCPSSTQDCTNGTLRLVNGSLESAGRVEVCINGLWGTVCDSGWDNNDARVVCRQLGYGGGGIAVHNAPFGQGTDPVLLYDVRCTGTESSLLSCSHDGTYLHYCLHSNDAGVVCPPSVQSCTNGTLRLVNGSLESAGRVEICVNGVWGTVCDYNWDNNDTRVVCRQLGYSAGGGIAVYQAGFGQGTGPAFLYNVRCTGTESSLLSCSHRGIGLVYCSHSQDAGVVCPPSAQPCTNGTVRLANGSLESAGRVEICINGVWGTVCDNGWDNNDARVVCRQLGYSVNSGGAFAVYRAAFGQGTGPVFLRYLSCTGRESSLLSCSHRSGSCLHSQDVGVVCPPSTQSCTNGTVRLVNGPLESAGRVEICINGVWGTVCSSWWDNNDARVVCRQLGYNVNTGGAIAVYQAAFGQGTGPVLLNGLRCTGTESSLLSCSRSGTPSCSHLSDAGVVCPPSIQSCTNGTLRLVDGPLESAGRVEICINGVWGTVCHNNWDNNDARVVCRQLGYSVNSGGVFAVYQAAFGQGTGPVIRSNVRCTGTESSLLSCSHRSGSCSHSQDAGVICPPSVQNCTNGTLRLVNGSVESAGRVEICINGVWGTVCDTRYYYYYYQDINVATVVCKQLGYNVSLGRAIAVHHAGFGQGTGPVFLSDVRCTGNEYSLLSCSHSGIGTSCSHSYDFGVVCPPAPCSGGCNRENGGGTCIGPETCVCNDEWTGSNCETPVCVPPCENGVCDRPGNCTCDPGWTGSRCRIDINECGQNNGGCDRFCNNTEGSFHCTCGNGYSLNEDGRQCDDINECQDGNNGGCTDQCTNTRGSYQCSCRRGYEFRREDEAPGSGVGSVINTDAGRLCQDVNECAIVNGGCEHECINTEASFYCDCRDGHMLESNNRTCEDIPECTTGRHNCTGNAMCVEAVGFFTCVCPANYRIDEDTYASCKDINECEEGISGCSQLCNNTVGGYFCSCMAGYSLLEDGRNCVDVDECSTNNGGCEHECTNTVGSFMCSCSRGYALESDGLNCRPLMCPILAAPQNGTISCPLGRTTGSMCTFTCDAGFTLIGSSRRICRTTTVWTGTLTFCRPLQCVPLEPPENGVIVAPCYRDYTSACTVLCAIGYTINGSAINGSAINGSAIQTCILDSQSGEVHWTEQPMCVESSICGSNPCLHNGTCAAVDSIEGFTCDCEGTGYNGPTCNRGIVTIQSIPTIIENAPSTMLEIAANPDDALTVRIQSNDKKGLTVTPLQVTIKYPETKAQFNIEGKQSGRYTLNYDLSGRSADNFATPEDSAIFVAKERFGSSNRYFQAVDANIGILKQSCCALNTTIYSNCPMKAEKVQLVSTCSWLPHKGGQLYTTSGIVFSNFSNLSLPLSIAGINVTLSQNSLITELLQSSSSSTCTPCDANRNNIADPTRPFPSEYEKCYYYNFTTSDLEDLLTSRSLGTTYLNRIGAILPSWIRITPIPDRNPSFNIDDFSGSLVRQDDLSGVPGCAEIVADEQGLYSVFRYSRTLASFISGLTLFYIPTLSDAPLCFAVNLCEGTSSPVFVQLAPSLQTNIKSLLFLRQFVARRWEFTIPSAAIFNTPKSIIVNSTYWNGSALYQPSLPPFDLMMKAEVTVDLSSGTLGVGFDFSGNVHYLFNRMVLQERNAILDGRTQLVITTHIGGSPTTLVLTSREGQSILFTPENQRRNCQSNQSPSGLSLKVVYRPRSGQRFFSGLFSFPEETVECPSDIFMNLDSSLRLQGLSLHMNMGCPWLTLGQLTFTGMVHTLYFPGTLGLDLFCIDHSDLEVPNPSLVIYSTLQESRLPLGNFMTLLPGPNSTALSVAFESTNTSWFHAQMHSVAISILGTNFIVPVEIRDNTLQFSAETDIFGSHPVHLTGTAPTDSPWNRLSLSIHGKMADSFIESVEDYIHNFINATAIRARHRQRNAEMVVQRARESLNSLETEYSRREQALLLANMTYEEAVEQVEVANNSLESAQRAFQTANTALQEAQNGMSAICNEEDCEDVSRCRQEAYTCYNDTIVSVSTMCTSFVESFEYREYVIYRTRTEWRWIRACGDYCYRICYIFFSIQRCIYQDQCRGICAPIKVRYPVTIRERIRVLKNKTMPCTMQRFNGTVSGQCSRSVCQRYPNVVCMQRCRSARRQAIGQLQRSREEIAEPFRVLDEARQRFSIAQSTLSRASVRRRGAQQMRDQIIPPYNSARTAKDLSEQNKEEILSQIQRELTIADLLDQEMMLDNIFKLVNITFDVNVITESPPRFPLLYTYEMPTRNQHFQKSILYDFSAPIGPNLRKVGEEVLNSLFNLSYVGNNFKKRSVEHNIQKRQAEIVGTELNEQNFQESCADLANIGEYFGELHGSLRKLNDGIESAKQDISQARLRLMNQMQPDPTRYDSIINCNALESFNATCNNMTNGTDDEAVQAFSDLLKEFLQAATQLSETVGDTTFVEWQAAMEEIHEQTRSVAGYSCTGFVGCLEFSVEIVKKLLEDMTQSPEVADLLSQLSVAEDELLKLGTAMNLSIPEAIEKLTPILQITQADILSVFWCATAPNITVQPPSVVSVQSGKNLVLNCSAQSTVSVSYHWRRDGAPIPNSESSTLLIPNMQRVDSGNYTCVASNPVAEIRSLNASVVVYELPVFYLEPSPLAVYAGNESGALFACNATSWPYPGWRWYFRKTEDSSWTVIEGEITNELLIPNPQKVNEGWYTCDAYNSFASKRAQPVYLTILPISVSRLGMQVEFEMNVSALSNTCNNVSMLEEAIQDFLLEMVEFGTTTVTQLNVTVDSDNPNSYLAKFIVISLNATTENTHLSTLQEIENLALPSRGDLLNARNSLQSVFEGKDISFTCNSTSYQVLPSSLTFQILTYFCPPGQQLHANYLLCVGCEHGYYQSTTEQTRVFNGQGVSERFPMCKPCPMGFYEDRVGSTGCIPCPEYYRTNSTGAKSVKECFVDPLLLECSSTGTDSQVTVNCRTNRPTATIMCSFDGRLEHPCEWPLVINVRTAFTAGNHSVSITAADSIGLSARNIVPFTLVDTTRTNLFPDVPPLGISFTNDSPRISGNMVEAEFILTRPAFSVTCQISRHQEKECSSGNVTFTDLAPGRYVLRVAATNSREDRAIERRSFEITSDPSFCTTHLINGGVTVSGGTATVEFAGTGPAKTFRCKLDTEPAFACSSPVKLNGLGPGEHSLKIVPQGCGKKRSQQIVKFTV